MEHAAEFRRCLEELDIAGIERLWAHVCPHLPQPHGPAETIVAIHEARVRAQSLHPRLKQYSRAWLRERDTRIISKAVGLAFKAPLHRMEQATNMRDAANDAILRAVREGLDLEDDALEVRRRMKRARERA